MLTTGMDFINGRVGYTSCKFVSKERYNLDLNIMVQKRGMLVTKGGTIGKVAAVEGPPGPVTLNAGTFVVRNKSGSYLTAFIRQCPQSASFQQFINHVERGATISHLNQGVFINFHTPATEVGIRRHVDFVRQVDGLNRRSAGVSDE